MFTEQIERMVDAANNAAYVGGHKIRAARRMNSQFSTCGGTQTIGNWQPRERTTWKRSL